MLLLAPLLAVVAHYYLLLKNVEPPPPDFGGASCFDQIASRYDLVNRVLALHMDVGWRKTMVNKVKEYSPKRILDLATGTADVALLLAESIPDATIIGVDPSHNMLEVGRTKVKHQDLENRIQLQQGDAQDLISTFEPESFDAATMSFGIRNVPNRQLALCQIRQVLKPSSVFCILEFSEPPSDAGIMAFLARLFIRHVVPVIGGIVSGAPREYLHLQNSIKDFPSPPEFVQLLENLSCDGANGGAFRVEELIQMNFGSVQLYVTTPITKDEEANNDNEK